MAKVKVVAPLATPSASDPYAEAERQRAIAQALAQRGTASQRQAPTSEAAVLNGVNDLLAHALSNSAAKKAGAAQATADRGTSTANRQLIQAMMQKPGMQVEGLDAENPGITLPGKLDPKANDLTQALAGQDPRAVQSLLAQQQMKTLMPDPSEVADRELKSQIAMQAAADRQAGIEERSASREQRITELQMRLQDQRATAEDRANLQRELAALRDETTRRGQDMTQQNTQTRAAPKLSPSGATQARAKLADVQIMKGQLENLKAARAKLGEWDTGKVVGGRQTMSVAAESYDKALDAIRTTVRKLTRTPGEGSMSDWEGKMSLAQLPTRDVFNVETLDQGIAQLDELANGYETLVGDMLGQPAVAPGSGGPKTEFATEAEAAAAGIAPGTKVVIGGVPGTWQ